MSDSTGNVIRLRDESRSSLGIRRSKSVHAMPEEQISQDEARIAADLVKRIGDGDRSAESQLVVHYQDRLRYVLLRQMPNRDDLEDLLQATLMAAIVRLREGAIDEPAKLGGFIYGVLNNLRKTHIRDSIKRQADSNPDLLVLIEDDSPGPEQMSAAEETTQIVRRVISELSEERDRELLLRLYVQQQEKEVVCEALDIAPAHMRRVLHRAKKRLKELMLQAESRRKLHLVPEDGE